MLGEGTGVWVGIQQMEYGQAAAQHLPALGAFTATGTPFSVAAGRISFTHGFRGPAVRAPVLALPCCGASEAVQYMLRPHSVSATCSSLKPHACMHTDAVRAYTCSL